MDWKTTALVLILTSALSLAFYVRKWPQELIFFIGGALTLVIGITPAKEFMFTMTSVSNLLLLSLFIILYVLKEPLIDRSIPLKTPKDFVALLPEGLWMAAVGGFLFAAAFKQTLLPDQLGKLLFWAMGENPFFIVAFLMVAIYLLAHLLSPTFVLIAMLPVVQEALHLALPRGEVTMAAATVVLLAVFFSTLNIKTRQKVQIKVRAPLLIIFFLICTFLIPQFLLIK